MWATKFDFTFMFPEITDVQRVHFALKFSETTFGSRSKCVEIPAIFYFEVSNKLGWPFG